jgi:DNA-binding transcriptional LysR family regulator
VVIPLQEEPMVAALPVSHPLARVRGSKAVPLKNLASDPLILIGPPGTAFMMRFPRSNGDDPDN